MTAWACELEQSGRIDLPWGSEASDPVPAGEGSDKGDGSRAGELPVMTHYHLSKNFLRTT